MDLVIEAILLGAYIFLEIDKKTDGCGYTSRSCGDGHGNGTGCGDDSAAGNFRFVTYRDGGAAFSVFGYGYGSDDEVWGPHGRYGTGNGRGRGGGRGQDCGEGQGDGRGDGMAGMEWRMSKEVAKWN